MSSQLELYRITGTPDDVCRCGHTRSNHVVVAGESPSPFNKVEHQLLLTVCLTCSHAHDFAGLPVDRPR